MTTQIPKLCFVLGLLQCFNALYIERDSASTPFIYYTDRKIEFETYETEFSYKINFSIINDIKNEYNNISKTCEFTITLYHNLFNAEMFWNNKTNYTIPNKNLFNIEPTNIRQLKNDFDNYKLENKTDEKCKFLSSIAEQLYMFNNELNRLKKSQYSTISNIVAMETLLAHSYNFTLVENTTNPLDFSHWFISNFLNYTKISLAMGNDNVYLTIKIPLFKTFTLSKIYPKPILYNGIPHIYNTQSEYKIQSQLGLNYFSNFNENCFYANNKTFCKKLQKQNYCDDQYITQLSNIFDIDCFTRLPLKNIITQIKNNIYFLIFEPMTINITCDGFQQAIHITQPSKIQDNRCTINSEIFNFDSNSTLDFGIHYDNTTNKIFEWKLLSVNPAIKFYSLMTLFFLYLIIICAYLAYYHRKLNEFNLILNSPLPPPYHETQV